MTQTIQNLEAYTTAWDAVMNAELEVVQGVYFEKDGWNDNEFSVKVPNSKSDMELISRMDGDQPAYSDDVEDALTSRNVVFDTIADYPRHDSTLRILFATKEEAEIGLAVIKGVK